MRHIDKSIRTTLRLVDLSLHNRHALYVTTNAQVMLGYEAGYDEESGLRMTVRWLDQLGLAGQ